MIFTSMISLCLSITVFPENISEICQKLCTLELFVMFCHWSKCITGAYQPCVLCAINCKPIRSHHILSTLCYSSYSKLDTCEFKKNICKKWIKYSIWLHKIQSAQNRETRPTIRLSFGQYISTGNLIRRVNFNHRSKQAFTQHFVIFYYNFYHFPVIPLQKNSTVISNWDFTKLQCCEMCR